MNGEDPVVMPVDGVLDLHTFAPREASGVVEEYLWACREKGIREVRIIHGKGRGVLRRKVHALLARHPGVVEYRLDAGSSGWGATVVRLSDAPAAPV